MSEHELDPDEVVARPPAPKTEPNSQIYARMQREIRFYGVVILVWGSLILLFGRGLNAIWGIALLLVGLVSFYFRETAILVVYGVALVWASFSDVFGLDGRCCMGIVLFQIVMTAQIFRQYHRFRSALVNQAAFHDLETSGALGPTRAARIFPWAGGTLGVLTLGGLVAAVGLFFVAALAKDAIWTTLFNATVQFAVNLSVLALAVSLAALLSGFRYKLVSACGLVAGALVLLAYLGLFLLLVLGS